MTSKNPSRKFMVMTDEEMDREREKFQKAVERQQQKDREAAERARKARVNK